MYNYIFRVIDKLFQEVNMDTINMDIIKVAAGNLLSLSIFYAFLALSDNGFSDFFLCWFLFLFNCFSSLLIETFSIDFSLFF